ncbi:NUMOD1 domain-containing DNA-binding protein [Flavobacterium sp. LS1R10]|uniref:NUMOD1 domain-containing DNA-binding protein n=1 Tax=Flavobacterium sp. LS1R10 TaxID=2497482 RepID=UPI000F840D56|nr:NUMOD1 domain-containing DNA-binding protein [Flavobacterium sp. LS1R10]RTY76227.1 endonuclease [Flavobacterium sp. LS1R10]
MRIVYKVTNQGTEEAYIGITTRSIEERKADHIKKANKGTGGHFQEAIATYGADAFRWEQIDTAASSNELAEKEKKYILQYNSQENGYNSDSGGGFNKVVYQFDLEGNLIASFDGLKEIQLTLGHDKRRVSNACLTATVWKGHFWSYSQNNTFKPATDNRKKEVTQFTLDGEILARYNSVADASRITGQSKTCISRCCRGERRSSSGFLWKYQD